MPIERRHFLASLGLAVAGSKAEASSETTLLHSLRSACIVELKKSVPCYSGQSLDFCDREEEIWRLIQWTKVRRQYPMEYCAVHTSDNPMRARVALPFGDLWLHMVYRETTTKTRRYCGAHRCTGIGRDYHCTCGSYEGVEFGCRCGVWVDSRALLVKHQKGSCPFGSDPVQHSGMYLGDRWIVPGTTLLPIGAVWASANSDEIKWMRFLHEIGYIVGSE